MASHASALQPWGLADWHVPGTILLGGGGPLVDRLMQYCRAVRAMLAQLSVEGLLRAAILGDDAVAYLCTKASGHLHYGFLTPRDISLAPLTIAARATGFSLEQRSFPSTIMARELGALVGEAEVPTTIFKAEAAPVDGRTLSIEAFVPRADVAVVNDWIARGVGRHYGIGMTDLAAVEHALALCLDAGFVVPPFMRGQLMTNAAEAVTAFYADRNTRHGPLRLEFFYGTRVPSRPR